ncbi:MAG: N-acetylmuramoyl-L-alanine amidase [Solirubrobacterales bacterium]|nr:N-acetylmuramoyl-L-alanine amidase [Solirubrobacterales bacterium]
MFASWITTIAIVLSPGPAASPDPATTALVAGQAPAAQLVSDSRQDATALEPKTITFGDCGRPVARLERRLEDLHYLLGRFAGKCYDGALSQAVMAMQKHEGIDRDGVYGPQSRATLKKARQPNAPAGGQATRVDVDLSDQLAYVVIDGHVRTVLSVASGMTGYGTPKGKYAVYRKESRSWSHPYKVWMPWASYFNGGIALHENAAVYGYPASHGCVRVPPPFAKWLYGVAGIGVQVRVRA